MTEATVRRALKIALRQHLPDAVVIRYEDRFTSGIPDLSISWKGTTSHWEIKYADPHVTSSRVQQHLCAQLDTHGFMCRYIIFQRGIARTVRPRPRQIRIVAPADLEHWEQLGLVISDGGFNYKTLVNYLATVHQT